MGRVYSSPSRFKLGAGSWLGPNTRESQVGVLSAHPCCSVEIKDRLVGRASRLFRVCGVSLGRSKDLVDNETICTQAVKKKASCEQVTRVCLPGPKSFARLRDAEVDGMTPINMHFDPILPYCAVRLDVGIIRERHLVHAPTDGLDLY